MQSKIRGKALQVVVVLHPEESIQYADEKAAVLHAYKLVPEANRQFWPHRNDTTQTYMGFAGEQGNVFDRWRTACNVEGFASPRELILVEEFRKSLPESIVVHLNEQKMSSLSAIAVTVLRPQNCPASPHYPCPI